MKQTIKEYKAKWYRINVKKAKAYHQRRYLDKKVEINAQNQIRHYFNQYGITIEQKEAMLKAQINRCAICTKELNFKTANVDHDHISKRIRGILCNSCNQGLGLFKDDPTFLENAINYLNRQEVI